MEHLVLCSQLKWSNLELGKWLIFFKNLKFSLGSCKLQYGYKKTACALSAMYTQNGVPSRLVTFGCLTESFDNHIQSSIHYIQLVVT